MILEQSFTNLIKSNVPAGYKYLYTKKINDNDTEINELSFEITVYPFNMNYYQPGLHFDEYGNIKATIKLYLYLDHSGMLIKDGINGETLTLSIIHHAFDKIMNADDLKNIYNKLLMNVDKYIFIDTHGNICSKLSTDEFEISLMINRILSLISSIMLICRSKC